MNSFPGRTKLSTCKEPSLKFSLFKAIACWSPYGLLVTGKESNHRGPRLRERLLVLVWIERDSRMEMEQELLCRLQVRPCGILFRTIFQSFRASSLSSSVSCALASSSSRITTNARRFAPQLDGLKKVDVSLFVDHGLNGLNHVLAPFIILFLNGSFINQKFQCTTLAKCHKLLPVCCRKQPGKVRKFPENLATQVVELNEINVVEKILNQ